MIRQDAEADHTGTVHQDPRTFLDAGAVQAAAASGLLFVTGTDTGVGKTVTTAACAALLRAEGHDVHVHKPAQTGLVAPDDPQRPELEAAYSDVVLRGDAQLAGEMAGCSYSTGLTLRLPLAPAVAAQGAPLPDAEAHARRILSLLVDHDVVVVEGSGGLLVDLGGCTLAGIAQASAAILSQQSREASSAVAGKAPLAPGILVVCRAGLGTLNHTALTAEALIRRGLDPAGVVIGSWPDPPGAAELSNQEVLAREHVLLGAVPRGWRGP